MAFGMGMNNQIAPTYGISDPFITNRLIIVRRQVMWSSVVLEDRHRAEANAESSIAQIP